MNIQKITGEHFQNAVQNADGAFPVFAATLQMGFTIAVQLLEIHGCENTFIHVRHAPSDHLFNYEEGNLLQADFDERFDVREHFYHSGEVWSLQDAMMNAYALYQMLEREE